MGETGTKASGGVSCSYSIKSPGKLALAFAVPDYLDCFLKADVVGVKETGCAGKRRSRFRVIGHRPIQ